MTPTPNHVRASWQDELRAVLSAVATGESEVDSARLRELGDAWAREGLPVAALLLAVQDLTEEAVTAVITGGGAPPLAERLRGAGAVIVRELLGGLGSDAGRLTAAKWLWGAEVPPEPGYAVIAARSGHPGAGDLGARIHDVLTTCGRSDIVHLLRADSGYLLAPARDSQDAAELGRRLRTYLHGAVWLAVAWRRNTEIEEGRQEASTVLDLAMCLATSPGVHVIEDVVVEYALMRDTAALTALLALIEPVVRQEALRTTLEALIATAGNRSKAAKSLEIHRSTLEYRLGRIDQLAGHTPLTARGLQTLAAALTVHEVVHAPTRTTWTTRTPR